MTLKTDPGRKGREKTGILVRAHGDHAMDATRYLVYSHSVQRGGRADLGGVNLPNLTQENQWGGL